jgi:hypothetical protein
MLLLRVRLLGWGLGAGQVLGRQGGKETAVQQIRQRLRVQGLMALLLLLLLLLWIECMGLDRRKVGMRLGGPFLGSWRGPQGEQPQAVLRFSHSCGSGRQT